MAHQVAALTSARLFHTLIMQPALIASAPSIAEGPSRTRAFRSLPEPGITRRAVISRPCCSHRSSARFRPPRRRFVASPT
jgi:hypothetical protein